QMTADRPLIQDHTAETELFRHFFRASGGITASPGCGHRMHTKRWIQASAMTTGLVVAAAALLGQDKAPPSSYAPVVVNESFDSIMKRMSAAKPEIMRKHRALLDDRSDLSDPPAAGVPRP